MVVAAIHFSWTFLDNSWWNCKDTVDYLHSCTSSDRLGWGAGFKLVAVIDWLLNLGSTIVLMLPGFSKMVWRYVKPYRLVDNGVQTLDIEHIARFASEFTIRCFDTGFSFILPFFMLTKLSVSNCSKRSSNASRQGRDGDALDRETHCGGWSE